MTTKSRQRLDQARRARGTHVTVNLDYSTAVDLNNGRNYETVPAQCRMILHGDGARPPCNGNGRLQRHAQQRAGATPHAPQWRTPRETRRTSKRPSMTKRSAGSSNHHAAAQTHVAAAAGRSHHTAKRTRGVLAVCCLLPGKVRGTEAYRRHTFWLADP